MMDEPIQLPIDGVLDLHNFHPREIKELVPDYLATCLERGIFQVRIIHGKGIGNLRHTVHSILSRHPDVVFSLSTTLNTAAGGRPLSICGSRRVNLEAEKRVAAHRRARKI